MIGRLKCDRPNRGTRVSTGAADFYKKDLHRKKSRFIFAAAFECKGIELKKKARKKVKNIFLFSCRNKKGCVILHPLR